MFFLTIMSLLVISKSVFVTVSSFGGTWMLFGTGFFSRICSWRSLSFMNFLACVFMWLARFFLRPHAFSSSLVLIEKSSSCVRRFLFRFLDFLRLSWELDDELDVLVDGDRRLFVFDFLLFSRCVEWWSLSEEE